MTPCKAPSCSNFRCHVKDSELLAARLWLCRALHGEHIVWVLVMVIVIRNVIQSHVASPCSNPLNTALEWRFTGGSSVTLEGNRGAQDDIYCWIEVLGSVWTPHWDEFVRAVFDAWTAIEPDLKPHW